MIAAQRRARQSTSYSETANMLPHSILRAVPVAASPGDRLRKMNARAIMRENMMPMTTSVFNLARFATGARNTAAMHANSIAVIRGSTSTSTPKAAPAKAAWDMQKPIDAMFRRTTNTPAIEHDSPARMDPRVAVIRSVSGRDITGSPSAC